MSGHGREHSEEATEPWLTAAQVAQAAGLSAEAFDEYAKAGFVTPRADGLFKPSAVARCRLVVSLHRSGISLDELATALEEGRLSLGYVDALMPEPVSLVAPSQDDEAALRWAPYLGPILGTTRSDEGLIRSDDLRVFHLMTRAVEVGIPPDRVARIARSFARVASRLVDMQREFVDEMLLAPAIEETGSPIAALEKTAATRLEYRRLGRTLLFELMDRQIDDAVFRNLVQLTEIALAEGGYDDSHAADAVAFVDISEFSRLAESKGDDEAAVQASRLSDLIQDLARDHGGRMVKSLGDGALVHAEEVSPALEIALDAVSLASNRGIWPLHAGVNVGRVVPRDGDLFGTAVNLASRIAGEARPGEVVVSHSVVEALGDDPAFEFEAAGKTHLRNISDPVDLYRAARSGVD